MRPEIDPPTFANQSVGRVMNASYEKIDLLTTTTGSVILTKVMIYYAVEINMAERISEPESKLHL
jgi:hypothetical protein